MNALIGAVVRSRVASNLLLGGLLAAGLLSLGALNVRLFPEIQPNLIEVTVPYPGATPEEVEASVVEPIEERVQGIEEVREVRSAATSDLGRVSISFFRGADLAEKLDEVKAEVDRITVFPEGAEQPEVVEVEAREQVLQLVVSGNLDARTANLRTIKDLAERIRDDITALPGVSQASINGVPEDRILVTLDQQALRSFDTSLGEVAALIRRGSGDLSAGDLETQRDRVLVRTLGENKTASEFQDIVLFRSEDGTRVRVGDIADVIDGFEDTPLITRLDGDPAVLVTVFRSGDEQVLDLVRQVEEYLDQRLRPLLPDSLSVTVWRNNATLLRDRLRLLVKNGAIGLALVLVILTLFLDLRVAAWVAVGVSVSFLGTFALMTLFGLTLNVISLFGFILAIGIVVDDAIVVGENIFRRQEQAAAGPEDDDTPLERAISATRRVATPVFFAVTTTIVAFVPLLFLPGTAGQFIFQIAAIVIFILLLSLLESFFVLPHHLSRIRVGEPGRLSPRRLTEPLRRGVDRALVRFTRGPLRRAIGFCVGQPAFVLSSAIALLTLALALPAAGYIKFVFFPQVQGNYVSAQLEMPQSSPASLTLDVARQVETAAADAAVTVARRHGLEASDVLEGTLLLVGRVPQTRQPGEERAAGARPQFASVTARIMDADVRPFQASEFSDAWRDASPSIPGLRELVFSASLVDVGAAVQLEVSAEDPDTVDDAVAQLRQVLAGLEGVHDIRDDRFRTTDEITLELRPEARSYGITLEDVASDVRAALFGARALRVQRGREEVDVRVSLPEEQRDSLADLHAYEIPVADGLIPLAAVADISQRPAPARITRLDGRRIVTLSADTNTDLTSGGEATRHLMQTVVPDLQAQHPDLRVSIGGEQEEQGRTAPALVRNFLLALFAIYALIALAFNAYLQPFVVLGVIPFGLIGALLGHLLLGLNLTLLSVFGLIGLSGVIVNDALLMIDFYNEKRRGDTDPQTAIIEAALERFRPILLTSLTTFFGVFPLVLEQSVQARFLIPTAISLGFGILVGTLLLMFLVPALATLHARLLGHAVRS